MLQTRGNKITWLGHATFRITTHTGNVILIDPWLQTNPSTPDALKKPDRVDTMLITHGHFDHIADALDLAKQFKPRIVAIIETAAWLESKGIANTSGMNKGGTQTVGEIEVTMVNAIHSGGIQDGDKMVYGGEPCGYIIRLPGGLTIYHAGDTCVFGDMKIIGELYAPTLAMLPVGDHYTMGPREAALAIRLLNVKHVIPMHYGTFPALTGRPDALQDLTRDVPSLEYHILKPGETIGEEKAAIAR